MTGIHKIGKKLWQRHWKWILVGLPLLFVIGSCLFLLGPANIIPTLLPAFNSAAQSEWLMNKTKWDSLALQNYDSRTFALAVQDG